MTQGLPTDFPTHFPARDYVMIGGEKSPGKATILSANSPREWDEQQQYGMNGATLIPKGERLSTVKIRFEIWDPNDIPKWYAFAAKFFDKMARFLPGTQQPKVLGIAHPQLAAPPLGLMNFVVVDVEALTSDEYGLWSTTVELKQYSPPVPAIARPKQALPALVVPQPTAMDAADRENQGLSVRLAGLAGQT